MEFLTANTKACSTAAPERQLHLREGQGRDRHRRRRHRHRLRRHLDAPRLQEPGAVRDPAQAADGPRRRTIPGRSGRRSTSSTTARRKPPRSSAPTRASISPPRRSSSATRTATSRPSHTVEIEWAKNDKGQFIPKNIPGTEKVLPAQLVLLAMGFLGPEQPLLEAARRRDATRAATSRPSTASTPPASRASSPPATAAAARAWSSGPSTKAAAPRASATAT